MNVRAENKLGSNNWDFVFNTYEIGEYLSWVAVGDREILPGAVVRSDRQHLLCHREGALQSSPG